MHFMYYEIIKITKHDLNPNLTKKHNSYANDLMLTKKIVYHGALHKSFFFFQDCLIHVILKYPNIGCTKKKIMCL